MHSQCDASSICVKGECKSPYGLPYNIQVTSAVINKYNYNVTGGTLWDSTGLGLPDPWVTIKAGPNSFSSPTLNDTLTPAWSGGVAAILNKSTQVEFKLTDNDVVFHDAIGTVKKTSIDLTTLKAGGLVVDNTSKPKSNIQKLTVKITPLGHQLGDLCYAKSPCAAGMGCLSQSNPTLGFCSKPCTKKLALCTGSPPGTASYCTITDSKNNYYCGFLCGLASGGKTYTFQCPSTLKCSTTANPPGSGQYACVP